MRFWWLIPVVLAACAIATVVGWMLARRAGVRSGKKGWVANPGYLRGLPKYQALVRRTRASLAIAFVCFLIAVIATSVSAGAPVDRYVKHDKSASRDIVLCLDASGSMLPYDSKIGGAFRQIISHFEGERISLQLWDAYSMTMFPLTDDYDMATDVLQDMSDTIDTGLIQVGGKISGTRELFEYLEPVLDEDQEVSSLVGDGLASCIMGFDHNDNRECAMERYVKYLAKDDCWEFTVEDSKKFSDRGNSHCQMVPMYQGMLSALNEVKRRRRMANRSYSSNCQPFDKKEIQFILSARRYDSPFRRG